MEAGSDLPPAPSVPANEAPGQDAPGHFGVSAEAIAEFAFFVAGVATGPLMADHPGYVFPAERVGALVRDAIESRFGFDAASLPGYRGLEVNAGGITKDQASLLIGVLEEEAGHVIEREDIARAIGALRDVSGLNGAIGAGHNHEGLAQARQTQPEALRDERLVEALASVIYGSIKALNKQHDYPDVAEQCRAAARDVLTVLHARPAQ